MDRIAETSDRSATRRVVGPHQIPGGSTRRLASDLLRGLSRGLSSGLAALAALLLALAVLTLWGPRVEAQSDPAQGASQGQRRVALVIGNGGYEHAGRLANPVNDAVDMSAALSELGWTVVDGYDLDFASMRERLRDFARALEGADDALFFYAGHGLQLDGVNYMVPIDARLSDAASVEFETVAMSTAISQLSRAGGRKIVLLDACRDNPLAESLARKVAAARAAAIGRGLAQIETLSPETLIVYSTQPGATATDGTGRNSPFTAGVLRHLETPGLEVQQLMRRVRTSVMGATQDLQVPWDNSSLTGDFFFVPSTEPTPSFEAWVPPSREPSPRQLDIALWDTVKDSGSTGELQSYLDAHPEGVYAATAKARIADIEAAATAEARAADSMADAIAARFAELSRGGVLVTEPTTAAEFYANARIYEVQGDAVNASAMYERYFSFAEPYVDPHYRNQRLLELRQGLPKAREVYNGLVYDHPDDQIAAFARILLLDREERVAKLTAYTQANPDFAPAFYELSRQFSRRLLGDQTLSDQRAEQAALDRLLALHAEGGFLKWFLDQDLASEQLEDARERLKALEALSTTAMETPVTVSTSVSNSGYIVNFNVAYQEGARELFVAYDGGEFTTLGMQSFANPTTGAPMPVTYTSIPLNTGPRQIQVKYLDKAGAEQGPFSFSFDPAEALEQSQREGLNSSMGMGWAIVQPSPSTGDMLVYFTALSYRCAIDKIEYGIGKEEPDAVLAFAPCDPLNPGAIGTEEDGDTYIVPIGDADPYVSMRLTYTDGTVSEVRKIAPVR